MSGIGMVFHTHTEIGPLTTEYRTEILFEVVRQQKGSRTLVFSATKELLFCSLIE